ncbi:MAG: hypothetical protein ACFFDP_07085 [Promethearchaeota archaeon]
MTKCQRKAIVAQIFCLLLLVGLTLQIMILPHAVSYAPSIGHQTRYDYGFISSQTNKTAADILYWTDETVANGNYTLKWHQYVNLTISVINLVSFFNNIQVVYNISADIHSNHVTICNSSWNLEKTLNSSVLTPVPTGIDSGTYYYLANEGVPGFFLNEDTLVSLTTGTNITVGSAIWNSISATTFIIGGSDEPCYQLYNLSITATERLETTYQIDQDVGIYYFANDTRTLNTGGVAQTLSYYYLILDTTVSLTAPPSPFLFIVLVIIAIIILVVVVLFVGCAIRRRWQRMRLPLIPEDGY